jgi:receptor protein-tyrosine kinase
MTQIRRRPEFSEAIRSLRMRVERSMDQEDKKVLLISSAIPGEGKSTISINLAISMAQRGKRVLLIDCDLRNPSVAKGLKIRSDCSLTDYLLGRMTLKELLRPTDIDNLYIIPGGSGDPKAADLLNQERGLGMIHAARNLFDFVILDTPPCSMLADTGEVAALADAGLLVVRQDFASRGQILDGVQRMGDADLPMIGWVFNHTKRSLSYNYGTYGYTYGYGYGKK